MGPVTIRNSIAHHNGQLSDGFSTSDANGNGFKLGGDQIAVNHIVENSIAFLNRKARIHLQNSNPGSITMKEQHVMEERASRHRQQLRLRHRERINSPTTCLYESTSSDKTSGTDVSNSNVWWKNGQSTNGKGLVVSSGDFVSLTQAVNRNSNGSPNLGNFFKLASGDDMKGAGVMEKIFGAQLPSKSVSTAGTYSMSVVLLVIDSIVQ